MRWIGRLSVILVFGLVTACGSSDQPAAAPSGVADQVKALRSAGWSVKATKGMPHTYSGAKQVAYLDLISPQQVEVDAQFLGTDAEATTEAAEARKHRYQAVAIGHAIVFSHPNGADELSAEVQTALGKLLTQ